MGKLSDIKKIVFSKEEPEKVEVKAMDLVDSNGAKIHVVTSVEGELTVGDEVVGYDADGKEIPAANGEYLIPDINKTLVVVDGKISEIKEVEAEPKEDEVKPDMTAERLDKIEASLAELLSKFSKVSEEVEKIGKQPASEPKKPEKVGFQKRVEENLSEDQKRVAEATKFIQKIKLTN